VPAVGRARFEQHSTFEDFDFNVSPKLPAAMLRDLSAHAGSTLASR
jgi:DNA replication protein DnaC